LWSFGRDDFRSRVKSGGQIASVHGITGVHLKVRWGIGDGWVGIEGLDKDALGNSEHGPANRAGRILQPNAKGIRRAKRPQLDEPEITLTEINPIFFPKRGPPEQHSGRRFHHWPT
jgi:hypothetical protein